MATTQSNSNSTKSDPRGPHGPGYGFVLFMLLIFTAVVTLTYTVLPLPGQRSLGAWNYVAAVATLSLAIVMLKRWRPSPIIDEAPSIRPRVK